MANDVKIPVSANVKGLADELNKIPAAVEQASRRMAKFKWNPIDLKLIDGDLKKLERLIADFHKRVGQMQLSVAGGAPGATVPGVPPAGFQVHAPGRSVPGSAPSTPTTRRGGFGAYTHAPNLLSVGQNLLSGVGGGFGQVGSFATRGAVAGARSGGLLGGGAGLLSGLGIGALAFGAFKIGQGVSEGYELAKERAGALDSLKRQLGDVGISFERLKVASDASASGMGVNSKEAAELAKEFNRLSKGADRTPEGLAQAVRTGLGIDRSYGLESGVGGRFLAGMRGIDPRQNNRELALLLAETLERSGMAARADEVMQEMQAFAAATARMSLTSPNLGAWAGAYGSLMNGRAPGMTSEVAAGLLSQANSSVMRMGAAGEAGQNFMFTALLRHGNLDPIQAMALAEGGLFGTRRGVFGNRDLASFLGTPGGAGSDVTNFEAIRDHLGRLGGDRALQLDAAKRFFGVSSLAQAATLMRMDAGAAGNLQKALESAGVDINTLNPTALQALAKLGPGASAQQLREAAATGRQATEYSIMVDQQKALDDIKINTGDKLIGPINTMRDALVALAGTLAPNSAFVREGKARSAGEASTRELAAFDAETEALRGRMPANYSSVQRQQWEQQRAQMREQKVASFYRSLSSVDPKLLQQLSETDRLLGMPAGTSARQIAKESGFNPNALSPAGAMGLAQVMPTTLASLEKRFGRKLDPNNPDDAVLIHRELMRENLAHFGNLPDALKAYNGGWDRSKWGNAETSAYTNGILTPLPGNPSTGAGAGRGSINPTMAIEGTFTLQDRAGNQIADPVRTRVSVPRGAGVQ